MEILQKIKSGEYQTNKGSGTSDIWKYFQRIVVTDTNENVPYVICEQCEKLFKFGKGASSSNLKKHKCYKRQATAVVHSAPMKKLPQNTISDQLREEVLQHSVKYICRDLQSLDALNGSGFKELARSLVKVGVKLGTNNFSIDDILPNSTTISHRLHKLHISERDLFVAYLRTIIEKGMCAGTVDMWTDGKKQRNFLSFTVHYLDSNWQLQNRNLFTAEFEYGVDDDGVTINTSTKSIIDTIANKFDELNLGRDSLKQITFTTDWDSNIEISLQHHSSINCSAHVLNTILKQTFSKDTLENRAPHISALITKCITLVENLERTDKVRLLEMSAPQECTSTWNTQFEMLCSIHKNFNFIENISAKSGETHRLNGNEKYLLDSVVNVLEPFKCLALLLEDDKNPTIHLVLLHLHILKEKLCKILNEENNKEIRSIVTNCLENIFDANFLPDETHKISAFLWPEYKQLRYLSALQREEVYSLVKTKLRKISTITSSQISQHSSSKRVKMDFCMGDDMLSKYKDVHLMTDNNSESPINVQFEMYKNSCYTENNILHWWRLHGDEFPLMSKLARKFLCIPAARAASERCFSLANRDLEEKRSSLKGENLSAILFLHSQQKNV